MRNASTLQLFIEKQHLINTMRIVVLLKQPILHLTRIIYDHPSTLLERPLDMQLLQQMEKAIKSK